VTGRRRWWWRAALAALAFAGVEVVVRLIDARADELRLALVVALCAGAASLLLEATGATPAVWTEHVEHEAGLSRLDPRTSSYLRVVEGHLSAREPDPALWGRLRGLADQTLRARHGVPLDDPRATGLLGPELSHVLAQPPRRMSTAEIDRCVTRIEEL
jgi:hypothetical protein